LAGGARAVLVKGGHRSGPIVQDLLLSAAGEAVLESPRIETRATHGTGCTLASAIAARLAQGAGLDAAVRDAREYLMGAIRAAPGFGAGHGPLGHNWALPPVA
jgi:hydroxymethylpyrimidine/phosphomethylpyrimidine kinase